MSGGKDIDLRPDSSLCVNGCDFRGRYHRAQSPTPSLQSVKSDASLGKPPNFSNEPGPPDTLYVNPPEQ